MRYRLMIPGPTDSPPDVRQAMAEPVLPHYGPEWSAIYWQINDELKRVFGTTSDVFTINGSGTLSYEIAMASLLRTDDRVLCIANSLFGRAMGTAAELFGAKVTFLDAHQFQPVPPGIIEEQLRSGSFALVATAHHDTMSGFLNPLEEAGALCRRYDVPLLVDCVSSIGALPFRMDSWGVDFACGSVQKALDCPAGIAVVGVSEKAWRKIKGAGVLHRGRYMNLLAWRASAVEQRDSHPTLISVATSNLMALRTSLRDILAEGLEERLARMSRYGRMIRKGLGNLGLGTFLEERYSPLLTRVVFPPSISALEAREHVKSRYGILVGLEFRIAHFGAGVDEDGITLLLIGLEDFLRRKGMPVQRGAAIEGLEEFRGSVFPGR